MEFPQKFKSAQTSDHPGCFTGAVGMMYRPLLMLWPCMSSHFALTFTDCFAFVFLGFFFCIGNITFNINILFLFVCPTEQNGIEETLSGRLPWMETPIFMHHVLIMQHKQLFSTFYFFIKLADAKALY